MKKNRENNVMDKPVDDPYSVGDNTYDKRRRSGSGQVLEQVSVEKMFPHKEEVPIKLKRPYNLLDSKVSEDDGEEAFNCADIVGGHK